MILLLVVAVVVVAALAYGGNRMTRSRARQREESAARTRMAAEAAQVARVRAEHEQHRAAFSEDDALTSVMPAIKLPWSNASPLGDRHDPGYSSYNPHTVFADEYPQPGFGGNGYNGFPGRDRAAGYGDLDADYPAFSSLTPFQADEEPARPEPAPQHRPAAGQHPGEQRPDEQYPAARYPAAQYPASPPEPPEEVAGNGARLGERTPPAYPEERFGLGQRPSDQPVPGPRPGDFDMPRRPAERVVPAARPGEQHDSAAERARRRAGQGSHRAEHAKRRRS